VTTDEQLYRDDVRYCAQLRLGEPHPPHDYTYLLPTDGGQSVDSDLRGMTYCTGLSCLTEAWPERPSSYAIPFDLATKLDEPPRGAVLAYQSLGYSGVHLDFVSVRAGNGLWYTTGGKSASQGLKWSDLWASIRRHAVGAVRYATAWAELDFPRPVEAELSPAMLPRRLNVRRHDDSPEWTIG
jgi:hypothetical protein